MTKRNGVTAMQINSYLNGSKIYHAFMGLLGMVQNPFKMYWYGRRLYWSQEVVPDLPAVSEVNGKEIEYYSFTNFEIPIQASPWDTPITDIFWIIQLLKLARPKKIMEFGTYTGLTTLYLSKYSDEDAVITTLDLPEKVFNQTRPSPDVQIGMRFRNTPYESKIRVTGVDLRNLNISKFEKQDFIFIDALHYYDAVKTDSQNALKLLNRGGMIIWHDYNVNEGEAGVVRYLSELNKSLKEIKVIKGCPLAFYKKADDPS